MSNFDFLQKEWPLVAKLAQTAENYIYDDPNSCLIKLGMLAEHIEDKIKIAFEKLIKVHTFNKIQIDLLEKIKTYMLHESLLNVETFEAPAFKMDGGFNRFNIKFEGKLLEIIREINTYIYEQGAVA